jgi:hypothetical protein
MRPDSPRRPQRLLEHVPHADEGADLLAEDRVPRVAVLPDRIELGVEFLAEG